MAASLYSPVPVINAGDGGHLHPTQTLTDLTTIAQRRGAVGGFTIGLCGDLKYGRTVHSLVTALSKFPNIVYYLISHGELKMPDYMLSHMRRNGQRYIEADSLPDTLPELDILYMTRVQRERFTRADIYERVRGKYILTKKLLECAKRDLLVLHPLPRVDEIAPEVDGDPRALYFEQARYGMFIRMALLLDFCRLPRVSPPPPRTDAGFTCKNPACITHAEPYLPQLRSAADSAACGYCDDR
jgi:aspartate carbamoyltransferase catalytic subunit